MKTNFLCGLAANYKMCNTECCTLHIYPHGGFFLRVLCGIVKGVGEMREKLQEIADNIRQLADRL